MTSPAPGGTVTPPLLLDEHSRPDFGELFRVLAGRSDTLEVAIGRIRLSGLTPRAVDLRGVGEIRVVLAEVNAVTLAREAEAVLVNPQRADNLRFLSTLLDEGSIEIRSAPLAGWSPDFTLFHRDGAPWAALVGLHWFERPYPHPGPALASLHGGEDARRIGPRFRQIWSNAHDVSEPVGEILARADARTG